MAAKVGSKRAEKMRDATVAIYSRAREIAEKKGIIIADTKFEFGIEGDDIILIDEVLTPDSSRFWPLMATIRERRPTASTSSSCATTWSICRGT